MLKKLFRYYNYKHIRVLIFVLIAVSFFIPMPSLHELLLSLDQNNPRPRQQHFEEEDFDDQTQVPSTVVYDAGENSSTAFYFASRSLTSNRSLYYDVRRRIFPKCRNSKSNLTNQDRDDVEVMVVMNTFNTVSQFMSKIWNASLKGRKYKYLLYYPRGTTRSALRPETIINKH
eukprot:PhF_6_TR23319/c0_g2_i2/m.32968